VKLLSSDSRGLAIHVTVEELESLVSVLGEGCGHLDTISQEGGNDADTRRECRKLMLRGERIQGWLVHLRNSLYGAPSCPG
jgi:hypothetical protein